MIYQTDGYSADNQDPTEDHIHQATLNALRVPTTQRFHMRMWFPHRAGLVSRVWDWVRENTHLNMSRELMENCGHIAMWLLVPEVEEVHREHRGALDEPLPTSCWVDDQDNIVWREMSIHHREQLRGSYYPFITMQMYEYARTLTELGYSVGFANCIAAKTRMFNEEFRQHLGMAANPVVMVHAGTKAAVIQHKDTRDRITVDDVRGEIVNIKETRTEKHEYIGDGHSYTRQPFYRPGPNGLEPLTREEVIEMGVTKKRVRWCAEDSKPPK